MSECVQERLHREIETDLVLRDKIYLNIEYLPIASNDNLTLVDADRTTRLCWSLTPVVL